MNKRMDWHKNMPKNVTVDYREDTKTRFLDKKPAFIITMAIFVFIDFIIAIFCSAVRKYDAVYQFEPWLLLLADLGFLVFSIFVNLRQKGAKIGFVVYAVISTALTVMTIVLAFMYDGAVVMSAFAAAFLVIVLLAKTFTIGWGIFVLPKCYWNQFQYFRKCTMYVVGLFISLCFLLFNSYWGFMGQHISVADKDATLTYAENGNGEFLVVGTMDDGNIINVPMSFNGRKVVGIEAEVLNDVKINLLKTDNEHFRIYNVKNLTDINPDLRVEISKAALNDTREDLFYQLRAGAYNAFGEELFNSIVPGDLAADETFYHFIYKGETPEELVYIPTVFEKKGSFDVTAVYSQMGGYFAHTELNSQKDLEWCYYNNGGYILDESNISIGENEVKVPFSKVHYLSSRDGNDTKWRTTVPSKYVSTADLAGYFNDLPTRNGFTVVWHTNGTPIESVAEFENYLSTRNGRTIDIVPQWAVEVPKIAQHAANREITYGENTVVSVKAVSVLPCTYRLSYGSNTISAQSEGDFALNGYRPTQSGVYTIFVTASDPEITSLTSEAAGSMFEFTINKKTLHVEWTLPDGQIYNKKAKSVTCDYNEDDVVSVDDVIQLQQSLNAVIYAGDYDVSVQLNGECDKLYQLDDKKNVKFSVLPKPVVLAWQTLSDDELVYSKTEKATSAQVMNLIDGDYCAVSVGIISENRVGAGEVEYAATFLSNTNYTLENGEKTVNIYVITPLELRFDWRLPTDLVYNAQKKIATVEVYNVIDGDECIIDTIHDGDGISAGEVTYAAVGLLGIDRANYKLPNNGIVTTFEIEQRLAYLSWDEPTAEYLTYSGTEKTINAVVTNLCGDDTCGVNVEITSDNRYRVGGVYYIAYSLDNDNYCLNEESGWRANYYITPLSVTISWQVPTADELVYNKTEKRAIPIIDNLVEGDDCAVVTFNTPNVNVGTVEYGCEYLTGEDSYNYSLPDGIYFTTFEITPRTVSFVWTTPDESELEYDGTEKAASYVMENVIEGDECWALVSNTDLASAGTVTYTADSLYGNDYGNYQLPPINYVNYEIRQRTVSIEWTVPDGAVYDKTEKEARAEFLNKVDGDDCSFVITHNDNVNAGAVRYYIVGLQGEKSGNYRLPGTGDEETGFVIEPKVAELDWDLLSEEQRVYSGEEVDARAYVTNLEEDDVCEVALEITSENSVEVGEVFYKVVALLNGNYKLVDGENLENSYTIVQRLIEFVWVVPTGEDAIYDAKEKIAYPRFDNLVIGDDCVIETEHTANVDAGDVEYGITGISGAKSRNYYLPTVNLTTSFKIEKRTAIITWTEFTASELIYNKQPKAVEAIVSNIQGEDECVATVVRTSVNEYDAGEIEYEVTALSNENYKIGQESHAGKTYTISPIKINLGWTLPTNPIYDGTAKEAIAELKNLINGDDCTFVIEHGDNVNAGTVEYRITSLSGAQSGNYELPTLGLRRSFDIDQRAVATEWTVPTELNYDGNAKIATISFTNIVGDDECTPVTSHTDNRNAGEVVYTLTGLDGADMANYKLPQTGITAKFTIAPIEAQLTWTRPTELTYDGTPKTASVTIANKIAGDDCEVSLTCGDNVSAGKVVYTAAALTGNHKGNYTLPNAKTTEFTISPLAVTIGWQMPTNTVYDGNPKTAVATISNKIVGDDCVLSLKHTNNVNAGTATCEVTGISGSKKGNYSLTDTTDKVKTFTIDRRTANLQWTELSAAQLVYDGKEKPVEATISNIVKGDVCIVSISIVSSNRSQAGDVIYLATTLSGTGKDNYSLPSGTAKEHTYKITKRVIELAWTNPTDVIYSGTAKTATATIANLVSGDNCSLVVEHLNNVNAGTATAKVTSITGDAGANYQIPSNAEHKFAINQRAVNVTWELPDLIYDGTEKTATPKLSNLVTGDEENIEISIAKSSDTVNVGEVTFEVTMLRGEKGLNYKLPQNANDRKTSFVIAPRAVAISWTLPTNAVYDGQPKVATANITNKIAGDDVDVLIGYKNNNFNAGTVTCTAIGLRGLAQGNYLLDNAPTASFIINQADRVATVSLQSWTYGSTANNPTVTQTVGDSATITYTYATRNGNDFSSTKPSAAGAYTVKATVAASNDYKELSVTSDFSIAQKAVTILWTLNDTDVYDGSEKTVTAAAQGLVGKDNCSVTFGIVSVNRYEAGDVKYRATALSNPNYTLNENSNAEYTITIKKATRSGITITMDNWTVGATAKEPIVSGYSGQATIEYAKNGSSVYSTTKPSEAGTYTVRLTIAADKNYEKYITTNSFTIYG